MTIARSGNVHLAGEYEDDYTLTTDDAPLFATKMDNHPTTASESPGVKNDFQMLPSGRYFALEKDERIWLHSHIKNNDTSSHAIVAQAILYYE